MMESHALARLIALSLLAPVCLYAPAARADNPIVQHMYTADPAPLVYDETVYLYTSHDEDVTVVKLDGSLFHLDAKRSFEDVEELVFVLV